MHRTTIELDMQLVETAKAALGKSTIKATVEEALRRVVDSETDAFAKAERAQQAFLAGIVEHVDLDVLGSGEMWR